MSTLLFDLYFSRHHHMGRIQKLTIKLTVITKPIPKRIFGVWYLYWCLVFGDCGGVWKKSKNREHGKLVFYWFFVISSRLFNEISIGESMCSVEKNILNYHFFINKCIVEMHMSQPNESLKIWVEKKPSTLTDLTPYISVKTFDFFTFISFFIIIRKFAILWY